MSSHKRTWLWVTGIVVFLICVLFAGWHYFKKDLASPKSKIVKPLLTDKIKSFITKTSNGLYQLKYDRFDVNIDSGKVLITNMRLIADTAVYRQLVANNKAPNNILYVHIDSLLINHFGFIKTDSGRKFNIDAITIKNALITARNKRRSYNDTIKNNHTLLKGLMKDLLKMTTISRVTMNNMTFVYVNNNEGHSKQTTFKHWNIGMEGFGLANENEPQDSTAHQIKNLIKVKRFSISTPDSLYRLIYSDIRLLPQQRSLYVTRFELQPRLNKVAFYKKSGFDRDRLHFIYNQMSMHHIDIDRLLRRQQIHIGSMAVGSSWSEVFNNYHWPRRLRPVRRYIYPQERLQLLALDITIDTIKMHKSYFRYGIAARQSKRTASLFMTNIESRFYHVTNNAQEKQRNPYLTVKCYDRMMGAADMNVKYIFDLTSKTGAFKAFIRMGQMDAQAVNPLAEPLGLMQVKSGTINKMSLDLYATEQMAKGNIDLYYRNLKLNLLKRDKTTDTLKKRGLLSFMTNAVMPNDNPKKNGKFRKGPIYVIHDRRTSFFGLLWQCMQDGMSSAMMGFDQHKDKPDENVVIKVIKKVFKPLQKKKRLKKDQ